MNKIGESTMFCDFCGGIFPVEDLDDDEGLKICDECAENKEKTVHGGPY